MWKNECVCACAVTKKEKERQRKEAWAQVKSCKFHLVRLIYFINFARIRNLQLISRTLPGNRIVEP